MMDLQDPLGPDDPVLGALARARPDLPAPSPRAAGLVERIMAAPVPRPRPRRRLQAAGLAVPALAVVVVVALLVRASLLGGPGVPTAVEIRQVAAASTAALAGSGQVGIAFAFDQGTAAAARGSVSGSFSGQDYDLTWQFVSPPLTVEQRVVGGEAYLDTPGPDGQVRWYHVTGGRVPAAPVPPPVDPRAILAQVTPAAGFRLVAVQTGVRHLRAASPGAAPALVSFQDTLSPPSALDLWVGPDDVVQRMDVAWRAADGSVSAVSIRYLNLGRPVSLVAPSGANEAG